MRTLDRIFRIALLLAPLLLVPGSLSAQNTSDVSPSTLYERNKPSVVTVRVYDANKAPLRQGSGFIVAPDRVVTNYHVIEGGSVASVTFDDGTTVSTDSMVAGSEAKDLAVLSVKTGDRQPLQLGNEVDAKVGETVYAIGSPHGLSASLSNGLVSSFRDEAGQFLIQVTASISPGSSGGPLFNSHGQVIGITTLRMKDGGFGFAVGASDLKHILLASSSAPVKLAGLAAKTEGHAAGVKKEEPPVVGLKREDPAPGPRKETPKVSLQKTGPSAALAPVQSLFDQKKANDALASFQQLPASVQHSYEGNLLLCQIQTWIQTATRKVLNTAACDAAMALRPYEGRPYGEKALAELSYGHPARAEEVAAKGVNLAPSDETKTTLGLVYYVEEKYSLVPGQISEDQSDVFRLTLLEGAAFHLHDMEKFRRIESRLRSIRGPESPWQNYQNGIAAMKQRRWAEAEVSFRRCLAGTDFVDPVCSIASAQVELIDGRGDDAKKTVHQALRNSFGNNSLVGEAIFVHLALGDKSEARSIHAQSEAELTGRAEAVECLYYYGIDRPLTAYDHCVSAIHDDEKNFRVWTNAGFVALDLGRNEVAGTDFKKAASLFLAEEKTSHTDAEDLRMLWASLLSNYVNGFPEDAKGMMDLIRERFPQQATIADLEKTPIVLSTQTKVLMAKATGMKSEEPVVTSKEGPSLDPRQEQPSVELDPVRDLKDQQRNAEALAAFKRLPSNVQHSFDGNLLLCEMRSVAYQDVTACDEAIALRPLDGRAYSYKGMLELGVSHQARAEELVLKGARLSPGRDTSSNLGLTYYMEEKYSLVARQFSEDEANDVALGFLEGAAIHLGNMGDALRIEAKLASIGASTPWKSYRDGMTAMKQLKWTEAEADFRKCAVPPDFLDPACVIALAQIELAQGHGDQAKKDASQALYQYIPNRSLIDEVIFIDLVLGDKSGAVALHTKAESQLTKRNETSECLYYYGLDQAAQAYGHCEKAITGNEKDYKVWVGAGYAALDMGRYHIADDDFTKAKELYGTDTALHSDAENLDILWGALLANYVNGSKENAQKTDHLIRGLYPQFSTLPGLEKLPLVWSPQTKVLISRAIHDLR